MTLKYKGGGFLRGIPARDLSDAEIEKHGGEEFLIGTGLYERLETGGGIVVNQYFAPAKIRIVEKDTREQQAPAAPEEPKRKTKKDNWKQLLEDG